MLNTKLYKSTIVKSRLASGKTQLQKSLITFLIFNSAIFISVKAQIIYTDVNPDITLETGFISGNYNNNYNLDLNNDGIADYLITYKHNCNGTSVSGGGTQQWHFYHIMDLSYIQSTDSSSLWGLTNNYPSAINSGTLIYNSLVWASTSDILYHTNFHWVPGSGTPISGNWISSSDRYLPIKFNSGGNSYFGWIRMSKYGRTIKDYAYNSISNQPILAGETTCATPTVTLSTSGPLSFCIGDSVTLTANGTGYLYQWKKNGVNISGATKQNYVAKTAGIYKCKVTNSCGSITSTGKTVTVPCRNSDASLNMTTDGLEHLSIYPNPAKNSVTIKIPSDESGEISIVNLFGRVVETHNWASLRDGELQIDVSDFPARMYLVRWKSVENMQTQKFSVIH